jgi:drug/metabolite transporter (DMT)-like permease
VPIGEVVLARVVISLAISYWMLRRANIPVWGNRRGQLVLRGSFGAAALACYFLALEHLPLADATTLHNTQPLLTALLAWWLLGERVGWAAAFAIACGLAGVTLVVHPGIPLGAGADPFGVAMAIASAVLSSFAYVTVRQLSTTEHPLVIVFYFPLIAAPLALPWALYDWVWPSALDWLLLIAMGVTTQVGQVFMTKALMIERAGRATAVGYTQLCFAMMWQLLIFDQWPALGTVLGGVLVMAGTLAVSVTSERAARPAPPPT